MKSSTVLCVLFCVGLGFAEAAVGDGSADGTRPHKFQDGPPGEHGCGRVFGVFGGVRGGLGVLLRDGVLLRYGLL